MAETTLQTELGQLSDTLCDTLSLKELTVDRWTNIVTFKVSICSSNVCPQLFALNQQTLSLPSQTAFYSFYLSVAFAMVYSGIDDQAAYDAARDILVTMGVYFQAQDDYLDCYGTPEQIGKIGTDIESKKCGRLFWNPNP